MKGYPRPVVSGGAATLGGAIVSIDNIRLDDVLGEGANAFVFDGQDLVLERRVAVKVWPHRLDQPRKDPTKKALAEARKLAQLKSDVIVPIYGAGRLDNGWIYAVMEHVEGVPFTNEVRAEFADSQGLAMRMMFWHDIHRGLSAAERVGIFHGDLHGGNVLVRPFHATLIDFGTSAFSGKKKSRRRHARMVNKFAQQLLPEFKKYIPPIDISTLSDPKFATFLVGEWVDACRDLQNLEKDFSSLTNKELAWRLTLLAGNYSTNLVDFSGPIAMWLKKKGVSRKLLDTYAEKAKAELELRKSRWQSDIRFKGKP
jgi:serine/threonine protein kinase